MNRRTFLAAIAAVTMTLVAACGAPAAPAGGNAITAKDPWARAAKAGGVSAAYMTLANAGAADKLVSASVPDYSMMVEVHQTKMDASGMMQMAPVQGGLDVPANGSVELKPGGYHIMIMNLKQDMMTGKTIKLTLKFQSGKEMTLDVPVKDSTGM
ncbi:MAG TPA: copper chaperone PCu(A)C [Thermoflexales bacterium]|nr:copper chaperone PCu(A)C [Thermoflexales bacterium]HQW34311.1 copper chaperone PCu(A)C [Thermoflexales bacterium]HQZ22082.1 copper chaperone PCu(A)C [Thermoflexales bacterium]HQZ99418.1 copper chaperone PCu(A)C [Thermoflexales bacterium]